MISRIVCLSVVSAALAAPSFAREGRGEHRTRVVCGEINSIQDARECMIEVGKKMPSENDENAVLVTRASKARSLLVELLQRLEAPKKDIIAVNEATYFATVVQNDDEEHIYYYVLSNGKNIRPKLVGSPFAVTDLEYSFCPGSEGTPAPLPKKFMSAKAMLLGMDPDKTASGTVWFQSAFKEFSCD